MRERGHERGRGGDRRTTARRTTQSRGRGRSAGKWQQRKTTPVGQRRTQLNRNQFQQGKLGDSYDWGLYKQAVLYFFTNFPDEWTYADMWNTFRRYGRVYTIYSPNRRSRNGSRKKAVAKFFEICKAKMEVRDQKTTQGFELKLQTRSYAEVVKSRQEKEQEEKGSKHFTVNQTEGQRNIRSQARSEVGGSENRKVWQEKGKSANWAGFEYNVNPGEYAWLDGCYVGIVYSVEMVRNLQEKFYMEGYFACRIRAMGGKLVLLDCDDKSELKDLVESASEWLGQWFAEVKPWSPEKVADERFVWIRCQGAPLNVWGTDSFAKMGSSWGKFIYLDDNTSQKRRFDVARFLLSTPIMNTISVSRQIKINGSMYNVKFTEEEFTNSFFSLKQDFMPTFQSESDNEESWSLDREKEDSDLEKIAEMEQEKIRDIELEEEDDEVAYSKGKTDGKDEAQQGNLEIVVGKLGSNGKHRRRPKSKPKSQGSSPSYVESTNEGMGQGLSGVGPSMGKLIEMNKDKGTKAVIYDDEERKSVQRELNDEEEQRQRLKQKGSMGDKVAFTVEEVRESIMWEHEGEAEQKQTPNPNGEIAGESIGDSGIENCNRAWKEQMHSHLAKENWDLAKQLGATTEKDKAMVQRIEEMERRDRQKKKKEEMVNRVAEEAKKWGLGRLVSDHCPLVLKNEKVDWGPKLFKFFDAWLEQIECKELIRKAWNSTAEEGRKGFRLKEKLKGTKKALKEWSGNHMSELDCKIKEAEKMIATLDEKGEIVQLLEEDTNRRKGCFLDHWKNLRIKESMWQQKSRKMWLRDGDANTKFYHNCVKGRWRRNEINSIQVNGKQLREEFHERGKMEKGANASFIVLIPKVENPQRIEDYRPISLIGVRYKILAKLLVNRLRKVLDTIIEEQQMAFIKGRKLLDGVIIANEVIEEAKRKKKNSFLLKVDFEKAYDKVGWDFIDYMLLRMWFTAKWRKWMKECLQSSTVSILINGSPKRQFLVSKGIRQGDPLSPFLFLIVTEGLNGLMLSAMDKNLYKGVRIGNVDVMVSHLQFADDTIFFGEASKENIQVIKCVLRTFELASGLKINYGKSQLMGIGVEEDWKKRMAYTLHCKEGELPVKYLGIQIGGNHRKLSMWQPLVNSFKKKLASWKGRDLSMGGRIALINSVLSSLPVFQMSAYLLPKGKYGAKGGHWMDWVHDGRNIGSLWLRDVRRLKIGEGVNVRWLWEDFRLKIGDGRGVKFWWDTWCGEECLANKFPRLYLLSTGKEKECHEMGNGDRTTWKWNLSWRRNLFEWEEEAVRELKGMIEEVKITPSRPNRWEWSHSTEGQYSTKIAYQRISMPRKNPEEEKIFKRVWNPTVPSKVVAFNWKALLDRIPTKLNLIKRGIIKAMAEGKCVLYEEETEDVDHLFLKCKVAGGLWQPCANWWGTNFTLHRDCWTTFHHFGTWTTKPHISEGWDCIWNTVIWTIWMARNGKVFHDSKVNKCNLFELIQLRSFDWIKARKARCYFSLSNWMIDPTACLLVNGRGK
ncbi:hypothetical protein SLEP1_g11543 [Rubroshorea leprosula]|nr:hypothetical protein SLEP1_g11543 [Rubroshorea leprosula]